MGRTVRPLSVILLTKDDTPERILFMYPYSTDHPRDGKKGGQKQANGTDDPKAKGEAESTNAPLQGPSEENGTAARSSSSIQQQNSGTSLASDGQPKGDSSRSLRSWQSTSRDEDSDRGAPKKWSDGLTPAFARTAHRTSDSLMNTRPSDDNMRPEDDENRRKREKRPRLPIKVIAAMLRPVEELNGIPFEVTIENVCYVGVPWHIRRTAQCISVIFVLPAATNPFVVDAYQNLSRKISIAINTEQTRCGFLRDEMQKIEPLLDRLDNFSEDMTMNCVLNDDCAPYAEIEKQSVIARTLRQVFDDVYSFGIVDVFVNDCVQVGFCVDPKCIAGSLPSSMPIGDVDNIIKVLQPYHTILFYEDCVPGPDSNPYVLRFFKFYDVERSLGEICMASKMPLQQVKAVARHYILWGRAKIIYPLCNTNVYTTIETRVTTQRAREAFRQQFGADVGLGTILASFHPPASLGTFVEEKAMYSTVQIRKQMILFMLRNNYLAQLHRFIFLLQPDSTNARFSSPPTDEQMNSLSNRIKTQIRQFKGVDDEIRNALFIISAENIAAGMSEADFFWFLSTFVSLHAVLNGDFHVEAIMYHRQVDRSALMRILDIFNDLIVSLTSQDFVLPQKHSAYPKRRYFV
ncbi:GATOR complex protein NPRL3 [Aphelenchoides fujianensis]|nr:GATOR complex protein NPRL3 [Aphelenchoides fujianensis]